MALPAMVLCAGLGTRLRPFTEAWPKPAIPFLGAPLFRYHLEVLRAAGVTSLGINTHHLPDVMSGVASGECARVGLPLTVVHEPQIQGTGGGIRGLRDVLAGDVSIIFNGDVLFPIDLAPVVEAHRVSGASATMVLLPMPPNEKYAAVELNVDGEVRRIAGKGPGGERLTPWHFTGVHVLSPEVFDFMAKSGPEDINHDVYLRMLAAGRVIRGAPVQGYWSDLGTPSRYLGTVKDALFGQIASPLFASVAPLGEENRGAGNWWAASGARVEGRVAGPAFIDAEAVCEAGSALGAAVSIGRGAAVRREARLNRCVVFPETEIAAGEQWADVLAWKEHRVSAAGSST